MNERFHCLYKFFKSITTARANIDESPNQNQGVNVSGIVIPTKPIVAVDTQKHSAMII
jgi:hypothetical protein